MSVFRIPLLLAACSATGLVVGLVADGLWDIGSWCMLAPPVWFSAHGLQRLMRKAVRASMSGRQDQ